MAKTRNILDSFEVFLRAPLSILKTSIIQIVEMSVDNFFEKDSSVRVDFTKSKTQITVFNNVKLYNLLSMATARNVERKTQTMLNSHPDFLKLSMSVRK